MPTPEYPLIMGPTELAKHLDDDNLLIVDLCKPKLLGQRYIPGAVHLDYRQIVVSRPPVQGLLPEAEQLSACFSSLGLSPEHHVVAYDDEGGGWASRLLWTLESMGHSHYSLLDGGIDAWKAANLRLAWRRARPRPSNYQAAAGVGQNVADFDYVLARLNNPKVKLLDCRSPAEYTGRKKFADRAGHIPGAVNFNWVNAIDKTNALRLKPSGIIQAGLAELGVTADKEVIVYCQTHHRSAHTYIVLKHLGFSKVMAYPGSWSEWGNRADAPVE